MKRKLQNTTGKFWSCSAIVTILMLWQIAVSMGVIEGSMLPSPVHAAYTFVSEFPALMDNARITLTEAALGLGFGITTGFFAVVLMDRFEQTYKAFYPLTVLTQTVPAVAMAPLLVLWLGYEMTPKVILIVIITFFPITAGPLIGFKFADPDAANLPRAMGVGRIRIFRYFKLLGALNQFSSSPRISAPYAVVGTVISEQLGGFGGLSAYMARARKVFSFDKMSTVIFLISMISLLFMWLVGLLQKKCMSRGKR